MAKRTCPICGAPLMATDTERCPVCGITLKKAEKEVPLLHSAVRWGTVSLIVGLVSLLGALVLAAYTFSYSLLPFLQQQVATADIFSALVAAFRLLAIALCGLFFPTFGLFAVSMAHRGHNFTGRPTWGKRANLLASVLFLAVVLSCLFLASSVA